MKPGISADLHLANKNQYPERYNAFTDIFDQCLDSNRISSLRCRKLDIKIPHEVNIRLLTWNQMFCSCR
jgi:hypothetical protein